jgi:hypothetical protein
MKMKEVQQVTTCIKHLAVSGFYRAVQLVSKVVVT